MADFKFFTFDKDEISAGPQFGDGKSCALGFLGPDLRPGAIIRYGYEHQRYVFLDTYLTYNPSLFGTVGAVPIPLGNYEMFAVYSEENGNLLEEDKWAAVSVSEGNLLSFTGPDKPYPYLNLIGTMCDSQTLSKQISQDMFCNVLQSTGLNPQSYAIASIKNFSKIADI